MGKIWDVIVVGARCAGSPTAMLLSRLGHRVLLLDRADVTGDTLSTHMVHEAGVARLARWGGGLLERLRGSGCPPLTRTRVDTEAGAYVSEHLPVDGLREGYCPRRTVLDPLLLEGAVAAGAEVRTGFEVQGLLWDQGRVVGLRGRDAQGQTVEEHATLVVGADGRHSRIAREVQAPIYDERPVTTCTYYTYWSGVSRGLTELFPREGRMFVCVPTHQGLVALTVIWPVAEFDRVRADVEGSYLRALEQVPELHERVRQGRREERYRGTAELPFFYRRPWGPGWALVGDAGFNKDPILAQGISDAFRDAELLAQAAHEGLTGTTPLEHALAGYERRRNDASRDLYDYTHRLSLLRPLSVEQRRIVAMAQRDPAFASRYHGIISGAVSYRDFQAGLPAELRPPPPLPAHAAAG